MSTVWGSGQTDWRKESEVREQVKAVFEMLESQGWKRVKNEFTPDNVPFPKNMPSELLFAWTIDKSKVSLGVRKMTFPKDIFPRDEDIYRLGIHINELK